MDALEPSNYEQAGWSDMTYDYVQALKADLTAAIARAEAAEAAAKTAREDALREAAEFCYWNAVGLMPSKGYITSPWTTEMGGEHPGMAYKAAILALINKEPT